MENNDIVTRLKELMEYYNYSPSIFADEIGIQRPSMSHILAGRNNPSLDVIRKVAARFPEIDLYWLLEGKGYFKKDGASSTHNPDSRTENDGFSLKNTLFDLDEPQKQEAFSAPLSSNSSTTIPIINKEEVFKEKSSTGKKIAKMIVLYDDMSYEVLINSD